MQFTGTTPITQPVVESIKILVIGDARQRALGAEIADVSPPVAGYQCHDDANRAVAFGCESVRASIAFARSYRSMTHEHPWDWLENPWLRTADFAESTQAIEIDVRILSRLSTPRSECETEATGTYERRQPSRESSKLSAVIKCSSADDDTLEIYAEPVDNDTLKFLRRC